MTNLTFDWQIDEFMVYCQSKQLRPKSMKAYEQALRLFQRWCLDTRKIENVDEVKENDVRRYIADVQQRGKYTVYANDKQKRTNYPERRRDYRQKVSAGTINNYIRNLKVFFNWLDENYILNIFGDKGTICSGTYLMIGPFESKSVCENAITYMSTKFFRALVAINKISQDASYKVYEAVPDQDYTVVWTDEMLYKKYGLSDEEISYIESIIRPMENE